MKTKSYEGTGELQGPHRYKGAQTLRGVTYTWTRKSESKEQGGEKWLPGVKRGVYRRAGKRVRTLRYKMNRF